MKITKKIVIIAVAVLVLLIGGGVAYATNTLTARADRQLNLGNKYLQEGKYQEAILAFQKVIQIEPKNILARLGLGQVYVATKEFTKAETVLKEVIGIDSKNIPARDELFKVYLKEGNLDAANAILQEIIQIDPNKDVKQLKADLESAKTDVVSNTEKNNSSASASPQSSPTTVGVTEQSTIQRMHRIILSLEVVKDIKSKGYPKGSVGSKKLCYFDSSKNIAYIGMMNASGEPDEANVVRIHNPKIISFSEVPFDGPGIKILRELGAEYNIKKAIKVEGLFSGGSSFYAGNMWSETTLKVI